MAETNCKRSYRPRRRGPFTAAYFWSLVVKTDTCWTYGEQSGSNYVDVNVGDRRKIASHRLAWALTFGPIPDGLFVCHHCDNPPCCRPSHMFLGTQADNMRDAANKGRLASTKPGYRDIVLRSWVERRRRCWSMPPAARLKISATSTGRKHSDEWKEAMRHKMRGRSVTSKMAGEMLLLNLCKMVCKRVFGTIWVGSSKKGLPMSAAQRDKLRAAWVRRKAEGRVDCLSAGGRQRIREAANRRWAKYREEG